MQQGQGGDVAITAQNLLVVDSLADLPSGPAGTVALDVQQLNHLDAQTLILGASSTNTSAGQQLTIGNTNTVELQNTIALSAPQILLAARDSVTVDSQAQVIAAASESGSSPAATHLLLPGGGALLRVSSGSAATLGVDPASLSPQATGTVTIGSGATVQAAGSLLLYGTNDTVLTPGAIVRAPAVSLYSSNVSIGDAPVGTPGLILNSQLLNSLQGLTDLTIGSSSAINFYGAVQLGAAGSGAQALNSINFDTAVIAGYGAGNKQVRAGSIGLSNSGTQAGAYPAGDGTGALDLFAVGGSTASGQITLGGGDKIISGFGALNLRADGDIVGQGSGSLTVAAPAPVAVNMTAAALTGSAGSSQLLSTMGAVSVHASTAALPKGVPAPGLGAALTIEGSSINQQGVIDLPSGTLTLHATRGDLTLGAGSSTLAPGSAKNFDVTDAAASGGEIRLLADAGNVVVASGANLDVSGANSSGGAASDAGSLTVSAPQGSFQFAGSGIKGAASSGHESGNFMLDAGTGLAGSGLATLDAMLSAGGFHGDLALRSRNDASVSLTDSVRAASYELAVDRGSIVLDGSAVIDTSGTATRIDGGTIALWAGNDLSIDGGATLRANGGAQGPIGANGLALAARGGDIFLGAANGSVQMNGGSASHPTVFASRGTVAQADGTLTLRAPRTADEAGVQVNVLGAGDIRIDSSKPVVVEGVQR